jgi:hypothetical protein
LARLRDANGWVGIEQVARITYAPKAIAPGITAYLGTNLDRPRTVKSKYDPGNMFRYEQSIPPAM